MDSSKKIFAAPQITIVAIKTEGIVCQSYGYNGFGDEDDLS